MSDSRPGTGVDHVAVLALEALMGPWGSGTGQPRGRESKRLGLFEKKVDCAFLSWYERPCLQRRRKGLAQRDQMDREPKGRVRLSLHGENASPSKNASPS